MWGLGRTPRTSNLAFWAIAVSGNYAFVASHSMSVVDMSVKGTLTRVGTLKDGENLNDAWAIAVSVNYAFVARQSMSVVDISVKRSPYTCGDLEGHHEPRNWSLGHNSKRELHICCKPFNVCGGHVSKRGALHWWGL